MVHRSEKGSETDKAIPDGVSSKKTCADCGTSKTPLWRGGPAGPKSLCNACGIRSRKKRRAMNKGGSEEKKSKNKLGDMLKQRLVSMGREVMMHKTKLREEEQAAVLLMALSYGSVYA